MSIILYTDGSHLHNHKHGFFNKDSKQVVGWGIVAHHNDTTVEIQGSRTIQAKQIGHHEYIAFIEAMLYAKSHGYKNEEMSFYSDEQQLSEIVTLFHPDNKSKKSTVNKVKNRLRYVCNQFYKTSIYQDVVDCLCTAKINWVKGHSDTLYNKRVDYLAKNAAKSRLTDTTIKIIPIEEHLLKAHSAFVKPEFIANLLGIPEDSPQLIKMPDFLYSGIPHTPISTQFGMEI